MGADSADAGALIERVKADPAFHALVQRRSRLAWTLSAATAVIYFGFILVVAFAPRLLATPLGAGVTTIGIPAGVGVILAAFFFTGIYVWRANSRYDVEIERIVERAS